jgi:uncharacterized membrane protein YkvA (DUF1232 family)
MTPIKIALTIGDDDLEHFRGHMRESRAAAKEAGSEAVIAAAEELLEKVRRVDPPEFVRERLGKLETLIAMVKDERWAIPQDVRTRVLGALAYFVQPQDMIPDDVPVLGFIDDAIIVELIVRELRHDIAAYEEFRRFGRLNGKHPGPAEDSVVDSREFLAARERLRRRARRRSKRERETRTSSTLLW